MPLQPSPSANGHVTQRRFCSTTNGTTNGNGTNGGANGNGTTNGHGTNGLAGNHAGFNGSSLYGGGGGGGGDVDYDNGTGSRTNLLLVSESKLMFVFLRMHKMSPAELSFPLKGAFHKFYSKGLKQILFHFLPERNWASSLNLNTCRGCKDKCEVQIKEILIDKIGSILNAKYYGEVATKNGSVTKTL